MPNFKELLDEIKETGSAYDQVRRKYITQLSKLTNRNTIVYYSGWLEKQNVRMAGFSIDDEDKNGFMATIHKLDRGKGLDLILHTPGGDIAATESLVDYLRQMFDGNIRAIVPQLALSAGTMIALSCESILMGKQSSLGPIDPQLGGHAAHGIIEEFETAFKEIKENNAKIYVWNPILSQYDPTLIGECRKAIKWTEELVQKWLETCMFKDDPNKIMKITSIVNELGSHSLTLSHNRHISAKKCVELGLNIKMIEEDDDLQDAILSVHHSCILTLHATPAIKIIENQIGSGYILSLTPK